MRTIVKHLRCELVLFILLLTGVASAQTYTATATGTVTDPNGQPVPNVKVTATNRATNIAATAQTGDSGNFTIPFLAPGLYDISAESTG
ncbi:MAG TPA: carboxypeptidase-like regulatory domain-containing protein, partial [Pyrinomonadaceae bacterium]|nr:carboxypeptidase-like regulatory domain-containing protein [Pyrinomonadaceae bacterium]